MDRSQPRERIGGGRVGCYALTEVPASALKCRLLQLTVLLSVGLFAFEAEAQTNRRKPKATPTPVVRSSEPAIISRADDYPTVVIEPVPVNTDPAATTTSDATIEELRERLLQLEAKSNKKDPDAKQRQLALNLDILTKSEQRSDCLRK